MFKDDNEGSEVFETDTSWDAVDPDNVPIDEDPEEEEDEAQLRTETYTVQKSFTLDDRTYEEDEVIPVQCRFCSMWKRPVVAYGNRPLCAEGMTFKIPLKDSDEELEIKAAADKWSCQSYFIPLDLKAQAEAIPTDYGTTLALKSMLKVAETMMRAKKRCEDWYEKYEPQGDAEAAFDTALDFVLHYQNLDQVLYGKGFFTAYVDLLRAKRASTRGRSDKLGRYDWVAWTSKETGLEVEGYIMSLGVGQIVLMPKDLDNAVALKETATAPFPAHYKYKEWKETCNPRLLRKSAVVDMSESDED